MAELKTQQNDQSVDAFLDNVEDEQKRHDCFTLKEIFQQVTGEPPRMWGDSIVGFGRYHYQYESGRKGEFLLAGFSPRKQNLSLYIMSGFDEYEDLMSKIGKHKTGKACLYIKKLADIDVDVLKELIKLSVEHMKATNKTG